MNRHTDRLLAHASALRARGSAMLPDSPPPGEILDSWVRCRDAGLDYAAAPVRHIVDAADLARRRERASGLRRLAQAELETLSRQIAGSNFLLAFADPEGVILDLYCDHRFSMSAGDAGIVVGSQWTEALCGTNGLGTALATGRTVAVTGLDHYFLKLGDVSCTAAPVRDAHGELVGVLDASSYFGSRQMHTQALVQMAATHIENQLLQQQMKGELLLAVHPRPEFLGTLSAGLVAFDADGRLRAANLRARQLLSGLQLEAGTAFEALFGEPLVRCLARLQRDAEIRLRDVLGSTLAARALRQPPLRAQAAASAPRRMPAEPAASHAPVPAGFVAEDPAMQQVVARLAAALRRRVPVMIRGETGTGKELLARHAHALSGRRGPFVAVNCGALPSELIEAELFGHAPGAFTGARRDGAEGLIASADGGTLLLDEIGELPLALQPALLRFLDDHVVRPVGASRGRPVDLQLLAATHLDLDAAVAAGRFRDDLRYRLDVVSLQLPPLRERSDFAAAVRQVLEDIDPEAHIDEAAVARLHRHAWPGNFRELRAVLTRALLLHDTGALAASDLEAWLPAAAGGERSALQSGAGDLVRRTFEQCQGSVSRTARQLGISRTTVYRHLAAAAAAATGRAAGATPPRAGPAARRARGH
ncbi:MAG: sigma-54-dependent Fis family transcriptional regulator [Rubrivivax sp.]|jgi:transcriptional regulator of acetoin/glycerol metabolism|nr:sigma-54-dependent Fis family transcriptional regulator [Rubrivivax sp.]